MNQLSATANATEIQMDYMKLLITQLQNQNPLEPLDNQEMASQLAQFSQLQQLEMMNSSFARVLSAVERTYADSLIGKEISFVSETDTGAPDVKTGTVEQVYNNGEGDIFLAVAEHTLGLEDVVSVRG
jgi:flagellar basal-body rod modification protein FlgD